MVLDGELGGGIAGRFAGEGEDGFERSILGEGAEQANALLSSLEAQVRLHLLGIGERLLEAAADILLNAGTEPVEAGDEGEADGEEAQGEEADGEGPGALHRRAGSESGISKSMLRGRPARTSMVRRKKPALLCQATRM